MKEHRRSVSRFYYITVFVAVWHNEEYATAQNRGNKKDDRKNERYIHFKA